jgi:hypothetical protein
MMPHLEQLIITVQQNCHITDARHARNMTLCSYLLEMREYYRWEQRLSPSEPPSRVEVSRWLASREALWNDLEECEFSPLAIEGQLIDPFAVDAINRALLPHGLVYGAGVGRFHKPHFFLAELARQEVRDGVSILVSGREYARDLTAAPAALRQGIVYLRQEALERWLWEKAEAWNDKPGAFKRAFDCYGLAEDPASAIARMIEGESETLILHELGEHAAGELLGADWEEMLASFSGRRAEVLARAVRDNLADCLVTLPALLSREASLHFWFANLDGMRRALFPTLASAYALWREEGRSDAIASACAAGSRHWAEAGLHLVSLYRQGGAEARIAALAEAVTLAL